MAFKIFAYVLLGIVVFEWLRRLPIANSYKVLGTCVLGVVALDALIIQQAVANPGSEGWGLLACMFSLLTAFFLGWFIWFIGDSEDWW